MPKLSQGDLFMESEKNARDEKPSTSPYVPCKSLETAMVLLRQGLPGKLDKSLFKSASGSIQTQLMAAFRFLRLIDHNDKVQAELKALVAATDEASRKPLLEKI